MDAATTTPATLTFCAVCVLAQGETPWQHASAPGELTGPYTGTIAEILAELASDAGVDALEYWERGDVLWVAPRGSTAPETTDTRSLTIDTCRFDGAEIDDCCWEASSRVSKCSNSAFHRMGQPSWWARIGSTFIEVGHVRADQECPDLDADQVVAAMGGKSSAQLVIGYGKAGHKDARRWSFTLYTTP